MLRRILRWLASLLGFRRYAGSEAPANREWQEAVDRYRTSLVQLREAATPEELEVAHFAHQTAAADLNWQLRLAKRERGLAVRPVAETHRMHQQMLQHLRQPAGERPPVPRRVRWRGRRGRRRGQ